MERVTVMKSLLHRVKLRGNMLFNTLTDIFIVQETSLTFRILSSSFRIRDVLTFSGVQTYATIVNHLFHVLRRSIFIMCGVREDKETMSNIVLFRTVSALLEGASLIQPPRDWCRCLTHELYYRLYFGVINHV